jgi:hypothetical protein
VSLYGDAIRVLRQVILLDERVRNTSADLARISQELADLRDRVSRLEGMLAASMTPLRKANPTRVRRRLLGPSDQVGCGCPTRRHLHGRTQNCRNRMVSDCLRRTAMEERRRQDKAGSRTSSDQRKTAKKQRVITAAPLGGNRGFLGPSPAFPLFFPDHQRITAARSKKCGAIRSKHTTPVRTSAGSSSRR